MKTTKTTLTRRRFTLLAAASAITAAPALLRSRNLNDKLNIAAIGAGGRDGSNPAPVSSESIVPLRDVNAQSLDAAAAKCPKPRNFAEIRKLFEHALDLDAVVVSIGEHTHAFTTLLALQHDNHVSR
jgi:predicted dehydrogenase